MVRKVRNNIQITGLTANAYTGSMQGYVFQKNGSIRLNIKSILKHCKRTVAK